MAQLLVRQLDEALVSLLKTRAALRGHSTEEEHRLILREVLTGLPAKNGHLSFAEYLISDPMPDVEIPLPDRNHPSERDVEL
ncbi:MAG: plasmid stability protein [Verrucomicrobiales bacterium]|jgi:plasmid stability protein